MKWISNVENRYGKKSISSIIYIVFWRWCFSQSGRDLRIEKEGWNEAFFFENNNSFSFCFTIIVKLFELELVEGKRLQNLQKFKNSPKWNKWKRQIFANFLKDCRQISKVLLRTLNKLVFHKIAQKRYNRGWKSMLDDKALWHVST